MKATWPFPPPLGTCFSNLDHFGFLHYVRILLHSLKEFFLLHFPTPSLALQVEQGLWPPGPRPN